MRYEITVGNGHVLFDVNYDCSIVIREVDATIKENELDVLRFDLQKLFTYYFPLGYDGYFAEKNVDYALSEAKIFRKD